MSPRADIADDFTFVMTCLQHTSGMPKPNFEEVAKHLGMKNTNSAYQRHWALMKKWGMAGNTGRGNKAINTTAPTTPASGKKRGRAAVKKGVAEVAEDQDELRDCDSSVEHKKVKQSAPEEDEDRDGQGEEVEHGADELA